LKKRSVTFDRGMRGARATTSAIALRLGERLLRGRLPRDFSRSDIAIWERVAPYTLTSPERIYACTHAVKYIVRRGIQGAIVECGVWRGGSMMAAALTLLELGVEDRHIWLYDTFVGMTEPTPADADLLGRPADRLLAEAEGDADIWAKSSLAEVEHNLRSTQYPADLIHFVEGPVEETLPEHAPGEIALLRLDTDWYESTMHELTHLFPLLADGAPLIVDDYGHWRGARQAVDEYFADRAQLLMRIDDTGRMALKV